MSAAGNGYGIDDVRGKLFYDFVRILREKQPLFFLAENVPGMMSKKHAKGFSRIKKKLETAGYSLSVHLVNAADYNVPQSRKRIFFIGYRKDLNLKFKVPLKSKLKVVVKDAITDLVNNAIPARPLNLTNGQTCSIPNHEFWQGSYSYIFMSRNRVLSWNLPSYTIQASGRQVSIHPQAPLMVKVKKDVMKFVETHEELYRRLTIRECARIQTFPDTFKFEYDKLDNGYKMVGNAVPVELAFAFAKVIHRDIKAYFKKVSPKKKTA